MTHRPNRTRRPITLAVVDAFLPQVDRSSDCWIWRGRTDRDGYGVFYLDGGDFKAHRVAYEIAFDAAPGSKCVCHRCDNPRCVRPEHLFLGTSAENTADRNRKGRQARGERIGKLNEQIVGEIRETLSRRGATQVELAKRYGVRQTLISEIKNRHIWKHVP